MIPSKSSVQNEISTGDLGMEIPFKLGYSLAYDIQNRDHWDKLLLCSEVRAGG